MSNNEELQAYNKVVSGNPNAIVGEEGETKLAIAAKNGDVNLVKILIKAGAKIDAKDKSQWQPLHTACVYDHIEVVKTLLKSGANVNAVIVNEFNVGQTALHIANSNGNVEMVETLLANGAKVNDRDADKTIPLQNALRVGHDAVVKNY